MPFESKLTLKAECEDCGRREEKIFYGDEFGIREEEGQEILDFMWDLEFGFGWELNRVSYEEHEFYCPKCKTKREAA
jgi:Zn finger protein HypA/HybF involved in hydrogenase expression